MNDLLQGLMVLLTAYDWGQKGVYGRAVGWAALEPPLRSIDLAATAWGRVESRAVLLTTRWFCGSQGRLASRPRTP
jgi:hypothetical protein